jgi:hypothetical protein
MTDYEYILAYGRWMKRWWRFEAWLRNVIREEIGR